MSIRFSSLIVGLSALGCMAGCGASNPNAPSPGAPASTISASQVSQLAGAVATAAAPIQAGLLDVVIGFDAAGTQTANLTLPCPVGGSAHVVGPITLVMDQLGTSGSISADASLTYAKCAIGGVVLDGGPLEIKGSLTAVQSVIQNPVKFTISGSHTFTQDGTDGFVAFSCNNSMTIDPNTLEPTKVTATGNASIQFPTGHKITTVPCQTFADAFGIGTAALEVGLRRWTAAGMHFQPR
jgi:hypothetical protein